MNDISESTKEFFRKQAELKAYIENAGKPTRSLVQPYLDEAEAKLKVKKREHLTLVVDND